jgi:predicted DNA binding protein
LDLSLEELSKFEDNPVVEKIKSLEILQFLKESPEELAIICRVEFADPASKIEDIIDEDIIEMQLLDHGKDGSYTYFIRSRPTNAHERTFDPFSPGGYLSVPFEIKDGRIRITYLGSAKQVKKFVEGFERLGVKYRVAIAADAKFPQNSPLGRLTEKQRKVIVAAYRFGYYDVPRKISSLELARKMKVGSSTLINHRRRAERRLLAEIVGT